ncbi:MAG: UDP-N-acetylglucosamine 1-carboxyvinyltransferase [Parcubacteria group bacterium]|nr:UDP-N-acetylglucosamine 1-carboxyvinyltransferase [Parcubacteria group bacterium]
MDTQKDEQFIIQGLSGERKLKGEIPVRGAKNAALKALAASLLFKDAVTVSNIPEIEDIFRACELLKEIGADVTRVKGRSYTIAFPKKPRSELSPAIANTLRASVVFTGPLLARTGKVVFPHPGGCLIGARPIDLFLSGFRAMGARVREKNNAYEIEAPQGKLRGAKIFFKNPSVTATETLMMAGVLARGATELKNAAMEPEIIALAEFLNSCGAKIDGAGTSKISIRGTGLLSGKKPFLTPPDRIEAGSFLILGALAAEDLTVTDCDPSHLESLLDHLRAVGVSLEVGKNKIRVKNEKNAASALQSFDLKTHEYPGFPTDLQAPMVVLLTQAAGSALVFETIFEGRFRYIDALLKMGAKIEVCDPHRVIVSGPAPLRGLKAPICGRGLPTLLPRSLRRGSRSSIMYTRLTAGMNG